MNGKRTGKYSIFKRWNNRIERWWRRKEKKRNTEIGQIENEGRQKQKNKINLFTKEKRINKRTIYKKYLCAHTMSRGIFFSKLNKIDAVHTSFRNTSFESLLTPWRRMWNRNFKYSIFQMFIQYGICYSMQKIIWFMLCNPMCTLRAVDKKNLSTLCFQFRSYFSNRTAHIEWNSIRHRANSILFSTFATPSANAIAIDQFKMNYCIVPVSAYWKFHLYSFGSMKQ